MGLFQRFTGGTLVNTVCPPGDPWCSPGEFMIGLVTPGEHLGTPGEHTVFTRVHQGTPQILGSQN